jgi:hypothetical protein
VCVCVFVSASSAKTRLVAVLRRESELRFNKKHFKAVRRRSSRRKDDARESI